MAETLTPNPTTAQKQRSVIPARLHSPIKSPFFLGSNDDRLEREQARRARAAAAKRKAAAAPPQPPPDDCLDKQQILELFQNCIKLASENVCNLRFLCVCFPFFFNAWIWVVNVELEMCFFFVLILMQKINQKNTWELSLIDHLCDIIKVEQEDDAETNFQKVSITFLW